jgi:hypothetical protein
MYANRALGLLAAILITAGQATLLAVDTSSSAQGAVDQSRYERRLEAKTIAEGQLADSAAGVLIGG